MTNEDLLKQSVMEMYSASTRCAPHILPLLDQISFVNLSEQYYNTLYQHIDPETLNRIYAFMCSEDVEKYYKAVQAATEVIVNGLEDVVVFVEQIKPIGDEKYN